MDLGRRLTNVSFVTFAASFEGFFPAVFVPFSLIVQRAAEPQELQKATSQTMDKLRSCKRSLTKIRQFLLVGTLLRQHATPGEVARLLGAFCYTQASRDLPSTSNNYANRPHAASKDEERGLADYSAGGRG